jgi:uncharacterized protein YkwD
MPLAAPAAFSVRPGRPGGLPTGSRARAAWSAVNAYRAEHHLVALVRRAELDRVARGHSEDMAARRYLAHASPEGVDWVGRLGRARVEGFAMAGENVGLTTRRSPNDEILQGWIRSPVHRENLLAAPYNATGLGIARAADGAFYYTQLYLSFPRESR